MSAPVTMRFESTLLAPRQRVWEWITSVQGIEAEMRPLLRMTTPRGVRSLTDVAVQPGARLFRSHLLLLGLVPIDYSDLTLLEITPGVGFVEQSPMGSMALWRHERHIAPCATNAAAVVLVDQLTFEPRWARPLVAWFVRRFFMHRHDVLRARFGGAADRPPAQR